MIRLNKMAKSVKITMISATAKALKLKKKYPALSSEQIIKHIMNSPEFAKKTKISALAAVNHILKYKEKNLKMSDKEIMQNLVDESDNILNNMKST